MCWRLLVQAPAGLLTPTVIGTVCCSAAELESVVVQARLPTPAASARTATPIKIESRFRALTPLTSLLTDIPSPP